MVAALPGKSKRKTGSLHGICVEINGPGSERLASDFDFFFDRPPQATEKYSVTLELVHRAPASGDLPDAEASRVFPDCVLYEEKDRLCYEYGAGAVLLVRRAGRSSHAELVCAEDSLAEEVGYLYLQSEIGRFLDAQGLHRVHGLGLGFANGSSALVLLPSGGGKSTLGLELLRQEYGMLLSDDTPLLDRLGNMRPFPLRLSFRPETELPEAWRKGAQIFERRKHGPKLLVPTRALPGSLLPRPTDRFRPGLLLLGERHGSRREPSLTRVGRAAGLKALTRDMVVGLGIPQVAELLLTRGLASLPGLAPTAASRLAAAAAYLARAKVYRFSLSRSSSANAAALAELCAAEASS